MAVNKVFQPGWRRAVSVTAPAVPDSGDPVRWGDQTGVALTDIVVATGLTSVDFGPAVWDVEVVEQAGGGIAVGDPIFLNAAGTVLSNTPTGYFFGYAEETIGIGLTDTICVHHPNHGALGTANLDADTLAATVAGRAIMEDDYFNAATLGDKVADNAFTAAVVLAKVQDDAITQAKIGADQLTGRVIALSAADAAVGAVPVVLRYDVPDMATGVLDFALGEDVLILDAWLKKVDVISSAHAHTIQVQTVAGADNITDAIALNAVPQHTIVRAATVYDTAIVAGAGGIRIDVVRLDGAGEIACEVYLLAVKV